MCVLILLIACAAPPEPLDTPRWDLNVPIPAGGLSGAYLKSATNAVTSDPDPKIRRSAADALGSCRDPNVIPVLIQAFHDKDAEVRRHAVWRFGNYPDARAVEPLIKLLKDPDASVRDEVLTVIDNFDDPRVVSALMQVLRDPKETEDNRRRAAGVPEPPKYDWRR
jgi:HEAT repeat protein